jgi:hypothetical protein
MLNFDCKMKLNLGGFVRYIIIEEIIFVNYIHTHTHY